jgi:hypothetical protein
VNTIVSSGISTDPHSMKEVYVENHFSTLEFCVLLHEKDWILACGTSWPIAKVGIAN